MPGFGKLVQRLPIIANACAWALSSRGCAMVPSCCSHLLTSTIIYNDYPRADDSGHPCLKAPTTCDTCPGTQTHPHEPATTHGPALPHASTPRSHTHEHVLGRSQLDVLPLVHAQTSALTPARTHTHAPTDTQIAATAATKQEGRPLGVASH